MAMDALGVVTKEKYYVPVDPWPVGDLIWHNNSILQKTVYLRLKTCLLTLEKRCGGFAPQNQTVPIRVKKFMNGQQRLQTGSMARDARFVEVLILYASANPWPVGARTWLNNFIPRKTERLSRKTWLLDLTKWCGGSVVTVVMYTTLKSMTGGEAQDVPNAVSIKRKNVSRIYFLRTRWCPVTVSLVFHATTTSTRKCVIFDQTALEKP
jgi:hypothetical protein